MDKRAPTPQFHHFLLVIWQETRGSPVEGSVWRIRLQDSRTGERWGFTTPKFLAQKIQMIMNQKENQNE